MRLHFIIFTMASCLCCACGRSTIHDIDPEAPAADLKDGPSTPKRDAPYPTFCTMTTFSERDPTPRRIYTQAFDEDGRLIKFELNSLESSNITYSHERQYDSDGNLRIMHTVYTTPVNRTVTRLEADVNEDDKITRCKDFYSEESLFDNETTIKSETKTFTYDDEGALAQIKIGLVRPELLRQVYTDQKITQYKEDGTLHQTYAFNERGLLISQRDGADDELFKATYNELDLLTQLQRGLVTRTYNYEGSKITALQTSHMGQEDTDIITVTYTPEGEVRGYKDAQNHVEFRYIDDIVERWDLNEQRLSAQYIYDSRGNLMQQVRYLADGSTSTELFNYDCLDALPKIAKPPASYQGTYEDHKRAWCEPQELSARRPDDWNAKRHLSELSDLLYLR